MVVRYGITGLPSEGKGKVFLVIIDQCAMIILRNRIMFEDILVSYNRLTHSIISSLLYWAGIVPNVDTSFFRTPSMYMSSSRS